MRNVEIDEIEFHNLFTAKVQHMKFALDQMGKMIEDRLQNLSRHAYDNELKSQDFKNCRSEIQRAIDGFKYCVKSLCENLKSEFRVSLDKIDPEQENKTDIEEFKQQG